MFHVRDHKTIDMFDRFQHLGPKRRALLDNTWARLFRDEILPNLPVHLLKKHYDSRQGRPTNELYAMMGAAILQQMHDLTDEQTVEQFCFNIQWHFALNITNTGDAAAYVSPRSIWSLRRIMMEDDIYSKLFADISDHLIKVMEVDTSFQRIDSVHIFSNMRHLGRIRLLAVTIRKFLTNLKRHHRDLFDNIPEELRDRYLAKKPESLFAMVKPSESARTLRELGRDMLTLVDTFSGQPQVATMTSFDQLTRLFNEQCRVNEEPETGERWAEVKANKEVPSSSLQNPSDPDAGYDGHKGQGYQVQVAETYRAKPQGQQEDDSSSLRLITHIEVEPANQSDAGALVPYLDDVARRDITPELALADSLYGSDSNIAEAAKRGTELVAPAMPATGEITLTDFPQNDDGTVTACPQGQAPRRVKKNGERLVAVFATEICRQCDSREDCPVKEGKRGYYLRYGAKAARLAGRRARERTEAFRERYRYRAGAEATMSELDRRTGIKHLRVRGMKAVRCCAFLKATGLNILRATAFTVRKNKMAAKQGEGRKDGLFLPGFAVIKELWSVVSRFAALIGRKFTSSDFADDYISCRLAA